MTSWFLTLLTVLAAPGDDQERANPIYRELLDSGVPITATQRARLPAPSMADGLSADAQEGALETAIGDELSLEAFTRPSPVAPYRLRLHDASPSDPKAPSRAVDVCFIAYGDWKIAASKEFLDKVLDRNREGGKARGLEAEELKRRGIRVDLKSKHEGYGYVIFPLLDRVEVSAVGHSFWSESRDSIVAAGVLDSRFRGDADLPNQWRPMTKTGDGKIELGRAEPYDGAGWYVKVTRLSNLKGALFVEAHLVFAEPKGWFGGANLLRSKLPPVIQAQVRAFRRELAKASR
jgi:hypothetical protein